MASLIDLAVSYFLMVLRASCLDVRAASIVAYLCVSRLYFARADTWWPSILVAAAAALASCAVAAAAVALMVASSDASECRCLFYMCAVI